jgi:transcriptional regulator with XRE-family HTH domain
MGTHFVRVSRTRQRLFVLENQVAESLNVGEIDGMDVKQEIGRRIRIARERKGWSGPDLCRRVPGLIKTTLYGYESGVSEPSITIAKTLAAALDVSAAWLLTLDDEAAVTTEERKLLHAYRLTDDRGRTQLATIADTQPTYEPIQDQSQDQSQTIT